MKLKGCLQAQPQALPLHLPQVGCLHKAIATLLSHALLQNLQHLEVK